MKKVNTNLILTILFSIICIFHMYPVMMILFNSFKKESAISTSTVFELPTAETFNGLSNYVNAIDSQGFLWSLFYSVIITVTSVALILVCCSMCAWYISRVNSWISKLMYAMCAFSMVAPFQLVMFTLSQTADRFHIGLLRFNSPYTICFIYLGFGAGLAVFMFTGFMKSIPVEMEEAAMIDGCNPFQTFFKIVFPVLKPSMISVGILETMWIWNDYLLPTLVLDIKQYKTIPMLIQYFRGSYGSVQMGPMMACVVLTIVPVIIIYLVGQKHIIKGVLSGAVKG
ncbi:MAG: carbohydrate ABC transporter permease [Candidatus Riflebacteria bacterium]|nr:carbohydrate ABC transporter permease [Candidatus Riflebacteria bacterium]